MNIHRFQNRRQAGQRLAEALGSYAGQPDLCVLGLPRGGVPVAFEVARALDAPLDVLVVRKLGVPGHTELALGALGPGGQIVLNPDVVHALRLTREEIAVIARDEQEELERREAAYRQGEPALDVQGKTVIVVDDGLATGATMRAALAVLQAEEPARLVVAVPVAAASACESLRPGVDELVCLLSPSDFRAVGLWYQDFSQTTDEEVRHLLDRARR